jgi:hypothetical protein
VPSKVTLARLVHQKKALSPMLVTLSGMVTLARLLHQKKALSPMLVTLSGMVTLARLLQPEKAEPPMLVTLPGMVTLARLVQREKALPPMLVTLSGMITVPVFLSGHFINVVLGLLYKTPSTELYLVLLSATSIVARLLQPEKAEDAMLATLFPMVTLARLLHL